MLHFASKCGRTAIVKLLLNKKVGQIDLVNIPNAKNGKSALIYAAEAGHEEICHLMLPHLNQGMAALMHSAMNGRKKIVDFFLGHLPTCLHYAICLNGNHGNPPNVTLIKRLIQMGANINAIDGSGNTPLQVINWKRYPKEAYKIAKALLSNGTDINHKNKEGMTALMLVVLNYPDPTRPYPNKNGKKIINLLLDHGANIHLMSKQNRTALDYAENCRNINRDAEPFKLLIRMQNKRRLRR